MARKGSSHQLGQEQQEFGDELYRSRYESLHYLGQPTEAAAQPKQSYFADVNQFGFSFNDHRPNGFGQVQMATYQTLQKQQYFFAQSTRLGKAPDNKGQGFELEQGNEADQMFQFYGETSPRTLLEPIRKMSPLQRPTLPS